MPFSLSVNILSSRLKKVQNDGENYDQIIWIRIELCVVTLFTGTFSRTVQTLLTYTAEGSSQKWEISPRTDRLGWSPVLRPIAAGSRCWPARRDSVRCPLCNVRLTSGAWMSGRFKGVVQGTGVRGWGFLLSDYRTALLDTTGSSGSSRHGRAANKRIGARNENGRVVAGMTRDHTTVDGTRARKIKSNLLIDKTNVVTFYGGNIPYRRDE